MTAAQRARRAERIMFRVDKGALLPADRWSVEKLRARGYHLGDIVACEIRKPRNPKFFRLVHQLAALLIQNVEAFSAYTDAHRVLKRLQWEANIACEVMPVQVDGLQIAEVRLPQSLAFESMDEGEFTEVYTAFCRHIVKRYWPELSVERIQAMAELMGDTA
jgi:hypothetical protein